MSLSENTARPYSEDDANYRGPSGKEKIERLRHEKINADPYTKRIAGRVAATPALQNKPVGLASYTTQPEARRPLEYSYLAVASAYGTDARPPFAPSFRRNRPAPHLNLIPRPIARSHQIQLCDNLLRGSGFRSYPKSMTGNTSTLVIQFVFLAAIILAPWFYRRSKLGLFRSVLKEQVTR